MDPPSPPRAVSYVVAYHWPCPDGAWGALAALLALPPARTATVPLAIFWSHAERMTRLRAVLAPGDTLFLVDFSGGPEMLRAACATARVCYLLDHHKTALEDVAAMGADAPVNLAATLDVGRSGATIARDHFGLTHAALAATLGSPSRAADVLRAFALVEDHDLWRHAMDGSVAFAAGLRALEAAGEVAYNTTASLRRLADLDASAVIARGEACLVAEAALVAADVARAAVVALPAAAPGGPPVRALGVVTAHPDLRSQLGHELAAASGSRGLAPVGVVAYAEPGAGDATLVKVSLRSVGGVDVAALARAHGGGGHAAAASFFVAEAAYRSWCEDGVALPLAGRGADIASSFVSARTRLLGSPAGP